ncbi:MAG: aldehyde dehydrogenase family protein [Peptococcaceae bacterium]|jgi:betaine-aldehyde dehydrogenase|nr:aldehyde dehydrogenase family protein [Peptococcaceae bacterium]
MDIGKMYINGEWVTSGDTRDVICPADGSVAGCVCEGTAADVDAAVNAAAKAFPAWSALPVTERAACLLRIADKIEALAGEFARIDTLDNGKPLRDSLGDAYDSAACFRYYAGLIDKPSGGTYLVPDPNTQAMVIREPIGVCGLIAPWNYPLMMAAWKIAPCIAAGNCAVFKPSSLTPLSTVRLFELFDGLGLPPGVANLVMGAGATVGRAIAEHPGIDKVVFTGGTDTGREIMRAAAGNMKGVGLELGGKSPCIVFDDYDLETAVDWALFAIFCNQGEVCSAGSRLILQDTIYEPFLKRLAARAQAIKVARGDAEGAEMGPLVSEAHMNTVLNHIETAKREGARLLCGGHRLTEGEFGKGYFVAPTIFADCSPDMAIVREEVFGPVLAVQKFSAVEEAVALANGTVYGLAGGVFSNDITRALRVVKALRAGITWVNAYHPTFAQAPWGGYKQSGIGRELGTFGLEEYTEIKQININLAPGPAGWFAAGNAS